MNKIQYPNSPCMGCTNLFEGLERHEVTRWRLRFGYRLYCCSRKSSCCSLLLLSLHFLLLPLPGKAEYLFRMITFSSKLNHNFSWEKVKLQRPTSTRVPLPRARPRGPLGNFTKGNIYMLREPLVPESHLHLTSCQLRRTRIGTKGLLRHVTRHIPACR